jgi:hypothetical protein
MNQHVGYLNGFFDLEHREEILNQIAESFTEVDFDSFAVCGTSGLLIGSLAADRLGKGLIVVRKECDVNHSDNWIECSNDAHRFVIIDDCISTGATIQYILRRVAERCDEIKFNMPCRGMFLYDNYINVGGRAVWREEDMKRQFGISMEKLTGWPNG